LTSHEGSGQQRGGDLSVVADEKAIALPSDRGEIAGRVRHVAQHRPNLQHRHPQHRVCDVGPAPHVLSQLGFGHQAAGMLGQIAQHLQGPPT
jgi:hypothetical protein